MDLYAAIRSRIEGGRPVSPSAGQAVLRNLYVAPTMEAARREAEAPILSASIYNDPFRGREVFYVARYPGRAVGFAAVDPKDADAAREFERSVTKLGLRGLKLSPVYHGFDPWSPAAWRLYEIADAFHVSVMFHMGGAYEPEAALEWGNPLLLDRVGRAFPRLRMIVAHLGQPMMQETVMLMRKNENVFADLSARFHRRWQLYNGLLAAIEYKVTNRLLFGSDFPVMTTREAVKAFRAINDWGAGVQLPPIPPELIDAILHERPLELVGLA
jgi:uncharacterized protein